MLIIGKLTEIDVRHALETANKHFADNIRFKTFAHVKTMRNGCNVFTVTLTVQDVNAIGARRNDTRKVHAACWHAHGTLFDALPEGTEIRSCQTVMHAGDKWHDFNMGSIARPLMASHACNCMEWNTSGVLPFPVNTNGHRTCLTCGYRGPCTTCPDCIEQTIVM